MATDIYFIISIILTISLSIILSTFGLYSIFLLVYSRKKEKLKRKTKGVFSPYVSIVLPTFNEGEFIHKKIKNVLNTNYDKDKIEIIISDDSTDSFSQDRILKLSTDHPNIRINRSNERRGYSKALSDGFKLAQGEIIIITDCGSFFDPDTIPELIHPLRDSQIGGVTGTAHILNLDEQAGKSESFYRKIYNFMRKSESNADSTFHFHGEVSSVRKELLVNLPIFDNLDIEIAFHIRKQGYRVVCNAKAQFFEYAPKDFEERHRQKLTRATGVIKVILGNMRMFSPQYGLFGVIIYPAHFLMMVVCPLFIALSGILYSVLVLAALPTNIWPLVFSSLIIFVSYLIKKELIVNLFQLEFVLLQAIWRAVTNKPAIMFIEKIDSTRR